MEQDQLPFYYYNYLRYNVYGTRPVSYPSNMKAIINPVRLYHKDFT